jgi:hypothetical protein
MSGAKKLKMFSFRQCLGSGSIQERQNDPQKQKKLRFKVLKCLMLKASPVAWTSRSREK